MKTYFARLLAVGLATNVHASHPPLVEQVVTNNTEFALDLYGQLRQ